MAPTSLDLTGRCVLVTGAGGFIGSTLADTLHRRGVDVVGADRAFAEDRQAANVEGAGWRRETLDLATADLAPVLDGIDLVFHLAGCPGVQTSWAGGFDRHLTDNIGVVQRLCEAALDFPIQRIVFSSSSSVYGRIPDGPVTERTPPRPLSPYGASKAAAEHVAQAYAARGLDIVPLRYFTVYGPRQRPDMALHRVIEAALGGTPFPLRGDGTQRRSFTHVDDIVAGTLAAADSTTTVSGDPINVGSTTTASLAQLIEIVTDQLGRPVPVDPVPLPPGDPVRTEACVDLAVDRLGWKPEVDLVEGVGTQVDWHLTRAVRTSTI